MFCAAHFPGFPYSVSLRRHRKLENQSHAGIPPRTVTGAGFGEHILLDPRQQLSQLRAEGTPVAVCALTPRPALPSSHRLFLHSQKHTVQIIKHLRGILHFHESISRELISQMLMPYTPGFSPTLQVGSGELILKPTRLELASDLQEPLPRAEEEPWQFCVCSFCSFS